MKICVIVLDYRAAARTETCLRSLIGQGVNTVLLVDNSEDKSASAALDAIVRNLNPDKIDYAIKLLRPDVNLGFGRGVNRALLDDAAGDDDIFLLMNNDATAMPGLVSRLQNSLVENRADIAIPTITDAIGNIQPMFWYQRYFGLLTKQRLPGSFPYPSGCCLMFRRTSLVSNRLFDEDFFMYGEDTELGWRLRQSGTTIVHDEQAIASHAGRGSSQQYKIFYEYHTARAHVLLSLKTYRNPLEIPLLVLTKSAGLIARALLRSMRARSFIPLRAFFLAWIPLKIRA